MKPIPKPLCFRCRRPVDSFTVTREPESVKFEAECHGGAYEMVRLFAHQEITGLTFSTAFRSGAP